MSAQEHLRQSLDSHLRALGTAVPPDRQAAVLAILRVRDRAALVPRPGPQPDLVTGRRLVDPGGNLALLLCYDAAVTNADEPAPSGEWLKSWAEGFLRSCGQVAEAEIVLSLCETGFMRLVEERDGSFEVWIATKRLPTRWRELADVGSWADALSRRHEPELRDLHSAARAATEECDDAYRRLARVYLKTMDYQPAHPPNAVIGGVTIEICKDVLSWLIAWVLRAGDRGEQSAGVDEQSLIAAVAVDLGIDPVLVGLAVSALTLDADNAAYHAAVPGIAAAPLVRIAPSRIAWSLFGLTTEPLHFLTRELRRRDAQAYHNVAWLREPAFRDDLYGLFGDKRFITSTSRVQIRRNRGDLRTDIDAAVFDRKTGTLGVFELKSQDPFARSTAELTRQRDNVLYANHQLSGTLDWIKRNGADEILKRVDAAAARRFRVQKVFPFVLGRYIAHFVDGHEPDRRAAWGTWPQLLRLVEMHPIGPKDANPIASIFNRLAKDVSSLGLPPDMPAREIVLGATRLVVYPSYAAYQAGDAQSTRR